MNTRVFVLAIFALLTPAFAQAREQIDDFSVDIEVQKSGDIVVVETIAVASEGDQIRRGIFRDLPRYYEKNGAKLPYRYEVGRVTRDGRKEPYAVEREDNAFRIRIGDADIFLERGAHVYEVEYAVKNQVRYFDEYDELYWNATGNYWNFPIEKANARVMLPGGAGARSVAAYTGGQGETGGAYRYETSGGAHVFTTTSPLARGEGLTVAVGFEKGVADPPSPGDLRAEWWARNASALVLAGALALMSLFYGWSFIRVGRDPAKGPVFPRYEPPQGYSPAAVHQIYNRAFSGHDALIATILNLAVKDRVTIDAESKKKTKLTLRDGNDEALSPAERNFLASVFNRRRELTLGDGYDASFTTAYHAFQKEVGKRFGADYFRWNAGYLIFGLLLTIGAIVASIVLATQFSLWLLGGCAALIAMFAAFAYFIPAPTERGQKIRTKIEGFRLYLKTAEKLHLDAVTPGSKAPLPMTVERYERFLPYAVALGVEEPWTRHFERLIPEEAANYQPRWAHMRSGSYGSIHGLNKALIAGMATGVASALPQSSSSSGSSGGGFSGGGGGGGGGGGW
jgi:hypothetical protein